MENLFEGAITVKGIAIIAIIIAIIYIWVFMVSMFDLWAGIRKAKKRGEYRSSKKLRRTIDKLTRYYNIMLAVSFVDALLVFGIALLHIHIPRIPYLTFVGAVIIGVIEIKSIYEKAEDKVKADVADAIGILSQILTREELKELLFRVANRGGGEYLPGAPGYAGEGEEL